MKKLILASMLVAASSMVIGLCPEMVAAESRPVTYITGQVDPPQYDPYSIADFEVRASCRDPFTHQSYGSGRDMTDAEGSFLIILPREQCPEDSRVFASAENYKQAHYGRASNFYTKVINSKLIIRQSFISMLW